MSISTSPRLNLADLDEYALCALTHQGCLRRCLRQQQLEPAGSIYWQFCWAPYREWEANQRDATAITAQRERDAAATAHWQRVRQASAIALAGADAEDEQMHYGYLANRAHATIATDVSDAPDALGAVEL